MLAVHLYLAGLEVDTRGALEAAKRAGLGEMERLFAEAVAVLRKRGLRARRLKNGFPEWRAAGLPVERQRYPASLWT